MDRMAYYFQTNLFCMIVVLLLAFQLKLKAEQSSSARAYLKGLLVSTFVMCFSDMIAGSFRGTMLEISRAVIHISNMVFFISLTVMGYFWSLYVNIRLDESSRFNKQKMVLWAIPMVIFFGIILGNPFTHLVFSIDENNIYHRNTIGVAIHWLVSWFYLVTPEVKIYITMKKIKSRYKRNELYSLLTFIIPPIVGALIQMFLYGITVIQVGVTISILILFLNLQNNQVLTDALTGLDNRRGFYNRITRVIQRQGEVTLSVMLMDLNGFKEINDTYGHVAGDNALVEVAGFVKEASSNLQGRISACRYGGDEFAVALVNSSELEMDSLKTNIRNLLIRRNQSSDVAFPLTLSSGYATRVCSYSEDFDLLVDKADQKMYLEKNKSKPVKAKANVRK